MEHKYWIGNLGKKKGSKFPARQSQLRQLDEKTYFFFSSLNTSANSGSDWLVVTLFYPQVGQSTTLSLALFIFIKEKTILFYRTSSSFYIPNV
jgi:hypothetical protein